MLAAPLRYAESPYGERRPERGERRLDLVELDQICDALGISLDALVKRYRAAKP